jgi:hypothetical protein
MMEAAQFPHQGRILNPTLEDYKTELGLIEEHARYLAKHEHNNRGWDKWRRWLRLTRRLSWMKGDRNDLPPPPLRA